MGNSFLLWVDISKNVLLGLMKILADVYIYIYIVVVNLAMEFSWVIFSVDINVHFLVSSSLSFTLFQVDLSCFFPIHCNK